MTGPGVGRCGALCPSLPGPGTLVLGGGRHEDGPLGGGDSHLAELLCWRGSWVIWEDRAETGRGCALHSPAPCMGSRVGLFRAPCQPTSRCSHRGRPQPTPSPSQAGTQEWCLRRAASGAPPRAQTIFLGPGRPHRLPWPQRCFRGVFLIRLAPSSGALLGRECVQES